MRAAHDSRMVRYSPEIAAEICQRLAAGESLRAICRDLHMPNESNVRQWALDDVNGFGAQYAQAREAGYHAMAEDILEIADETKHDTVHTEQGERADSEWIARSKLRVDARKWLLSKMLPKVFGDKIEHAASAENPLFPQRIEITVVRPKT